METKKLGKTNLDVSRLSLGGLFVAGGDGQLDQATATVKRAYQLGINYVDTAPGYGQSETVLGRVFQTTGRPPILSTKVGGDPATFEAQNPDVIKASVENSLTLLGTDHFEMVMVHEPDRPGHFDWWSDMLKVEGPVLDVLLDFKRQGVVRAIGLGGTGTTELAHLVRSGTFDVVLTAFNYSLLYREAEDTVIRAARENGVGVIAGSPLQQGGFAKKYDAVYDDSVYWLHPARRRQFQELYALADDLGMSLPELAIRFTVSNPDVHTVLMGARNVGELEESVAAIETGPLPDDVLTRLDQIASRVPFRPYNEPSGMGVRLAWPGAYKGPGSLNY